MMIRRKSFLTLILVIAFSIGLVACGPLSTTGTPSGALTPGTNVTPSAPAGTQSLTAQPTMGTTATSGTTPTVAATSGTTPTVAATQGTTPTVAQTPSASGTPLIPNTGQLDPGRVSNLLKYTVWSSDNKNVGKVDDLILDLSQLRVQYVVVQSKGQDIPVPWDAFKIIGNPPESANTSMPHDAFMLSVDQNTFQSAPTFDLSNLPALGQPTNNWDASIQSYWQGVLPASATGTPTPSLTGTPSTSVTGTPAATTTGPDVSLQGVVLASKIMNFSVQAGNNLGSIAINDIIIDDTTGDVQFLVIQASNSTLGQRTIPVPLKFFGLTSGTSQSLTLTAALSDLENAPSFSGGQYPNTQAPGWDSQIQSYWQNK